MSNLHEFVYQIVADPQLLTQFIESPQILVETFKLSPNELAAIKGVLDQSVFQDLLSPQSLKLASQTAFEKVWIPT